MKKIRNLVFMIMLLFTLSLFVTSKSAYASSIKRVSIIGDSISTYQGYSTFYYYSPSKMPQNCMYWQRFIDYNNDLRLSTVNAIGGSQIYAPGEISSYDWTMQSYYRIDQLDKYGTPDIIIVFGGINDHLDNMIEFCNAYYTMMHRIRERYPNTMIICVTPYHYDGTSENNINFMAEVIKNASAADNNSICVDLRNKIRGYIGSPYMQTQGEGFWFHPNAAGHKIIADAIQTEYKKHENQALYRDSNRIYDKSYKSGLVLNNISTLTSNNFIDLKANYTGYLKPKTSFSFEIINNTTGKVERSKWVHDGNYRWHPDANDNYTVKVSISVNGDGKINEIMVKHFDRPQMNIKIIGICAIPINDGLLYGCTSSGVQENENINNRLRTCCWIYSYTERRWITMSFYEGQNQAWFKTKSLPKGTYMMYNSTEKYENGNWRKLSCRFYNFNIQ